MVRRGCALHEYHKRDPGFFAIRIQEHFEFQRGWYRREGVAGFVLEYYFVLRSVLRTRPHLRPCLTRCRHCGILFFNDPRNRGRRDVGCPFGCREAHRKKRSTERSTSYNRTAAGKLKKKLLNGKRCQSGPAVESGPDASEEPAAPEVCSQGKAVREEVGMEKSTTDEPGGPDRKPDCDGEPEAERVSRDTEKVSPAQDTSGLEPDMVEADKVEGGMDDEQDEPEVKRAFDRESESEARGPRGAPAEEPEAGDSQAVPEFDAGMVDHIQMVTGLIEGREVSRAEVLEMLKRAMRQHSMVREGRIDYVLRFLKENPP